MDDIEIMYRQLAPYIKNFFDKYSALWKVPFHSVYLTCRYREGVDMDDLKAVSAKVKALGTEYLADLDDMEKKQDGSSEQTLLRQMFPIFKEEVIQQAKEWNCQVSDVYLVVYYDKGKGTDPDALGLQLRTVTDKKLVRTV